MFIIILIFIILIFLFPPHSPFYSFHQFDKYVYNRYHFTQSSIVIMIYFIILCFLSNPEKWLAVTSCSFPIYDNFFFICRAAIFLIQRWSSFSTIRCNSFSFSIPFFFFFLKRGTRFQVYHELKSSPSHENFLKYTC